jgi:hypothetical protein
MTNKLFLTKFLMGCLLGLASLILLSPLEFIAYQFLGPNGQPDSLVNREPIDWGKGDYWTPQEPYVCSGRHSQLHCSYSEYRSQTLILSVFAPVMFVIVPAIALVGTADGSEEAMQSLATLAPLIAVATGWVLFCGLLNIPLNLGGKHRGSYKHSA